MYVDFFIATRAGAAGAGRRPAASGDDAQGAGVDGQLG
jgi:hypothetical protein